MRLLESGKRVGCEVVGPNRTVRWWFEPGQNGAEVEVFMGADIHRYHVSGPEATASVAPGWLGWIKSLLGIGSRNPAASGSENDAAPA